MIICSFNINGLNSILTKNKDIFLNYINTLDIICLQEIRITQKNILKSNIINELLNLSYESYFYSAIKAGYSGTAIIIKNIIQDYEILYGINNELFDNEARTITIILNYRKLIIINTYSPNSSNKLDFRLQYDNEIKKYIDKLNDKYNYSIIVCGDLNCAIEPKDIRNLSPNNVWFYQAKAGFSLQERNSFKTNYLLNGFKDIFRDLYSNKLDYTWYSYFKKSSEAWRIDYFLYKENNCNECDECNKNNKCNYNEIIDIIFNKHIKISDHIPIVLILNK